MVVGMTNVIEKIILQAPNPEGLYNYHVGCGHAWIPNETSQEKNILTNGYYTKLL